MSYDEEHHRFAFANLDVLKPGGPSGEAPADVGVHHIALTYANPGDLLDTYARLKAKGVMPCWPIQHGITLSLYYRDPDGNRLELQVDACTTEEANVFMRSEAFAANPVGVAIDPEALLARHRAGAPAAELMTSPGGAMSPIPEAHGIT